MSHSNNPSANAHWSAPAEPMVPKLPPPEEAPSRLRPTGWSPTAWRFKKEGER
ncbi:MAG: hypothetical protein H6737_18285 [Alphaproteobacteria bacterium]|nr:hypothetical protein [Alphaproteobacteria bacterium]